MKLAIATLKSISPYSQSRYHDTPKKEKELPDDYELRTWRERCHADDTGSLFIPPMTFKNCLQEAARFLSMKIKGQRNATWTKHFEAGVLVMDGLSLPEKKDTVPGESFFMNADGVPGSRTRVKRTYPVIRQWSGQVTFHILDDLITEESFREHLETAGNLIGIGRFRPRNRGYYGRFKVEKIVWRDAAKSAA